MPDELIEMIQALRRRGRTMGNTPSVKLTELEHRKIVAALERAAEVAGQGCEFCGAMVDDYGEERDGGREPHANWWACGRCWNTGAGETSAAIGHLSELLERAGRLWTCGRGHIVELELGTPPYEASCPVCAALERIPELEDLIRRQAVDRGALRAALAAVPAPGPTRLEALQRYAPAEEGGR